MSDDRNNISIVSLHNNRKSTLVAHPDHLAVMGNLPHGYRFIPATVADAVKLRDWVQGVIDKTSEPQGAARSQHGPDVCFTVAEHTQAIREGWWIVQTWGREDTGTDGCYRVEKIDEAGRLDSDEQAWTLARRMGFVLDDDGYVVGRRNPVPAEDTPDPRLIPGAGVESD